MLQLFDFVSVETLPEKIKRFVKNAPLQVPLSDDEIMREVKTVRRKKTKSE